MNEIHWMAACVGAMTLGLVVAYFITGTGAFLNGVPAGVLGSVGMFVAAGPRSKP